MPDFADRILPREIAEATSSWADDIDLQPSGNRNVEAEPGWAFRSEKLPTHADYRENFLKKQQQRGGVQIDAETGVVQVEVSQSLLEQNLKFNPAEVIKDLKKAMAVVPSSVEEAEGPSSPNTPYVATYRSYKFAPDIDKAVRILEGLSDQEVLKLRAAHGPELQRIFLREPDNAETPSLRQPFRWLRHMVFEAGIAEKCLDQRDKTPFSVEQWNAITSQLVRGTGCGEDVIRQIAHLRAVEEVPLDVMRCRTGVGTEWDQASDVAGVAGNLTQFVRDEEEFYQAWNQLTGISVKEWIVDVSHRQQRREKNRRSAN